VSIKTKKEARPWPRTGETLRNKWNALKTLFTTPYRRYETSGQNDPAAFPSFIPTTLSDPERVRVLYMFHAFQDSASLEAVLKTVPGDVTAEEGVATPSAPSTPAVPSGGGNGGAGKRRRVDATQSGTSTGTAGGSADAAAAASVCARRAPVGASACDGRGQRVRRSGPARATVGASACDGRGQRVPRSGPARATVGASACDGRGQRVRRSGTARSQKRSAVSGKKGKQRVRGSAASRRRRGAVRNRGVVASVVRAKIFLAHS
jgi:hypothetical protein